MPRIALAALALFVLVTGVSAQQMGWVDVQKVVNEYKKTKDLTDQLEKRMAAHLASMAQEKQRIQALAESADASGADADPVKVLRDRRDIKLGEVGLEIMEAKARFLLQQDVVAHVKKVYAEVLREAEAIARERRLSVVFMVKGGELEGRTRDEVMSNVLIRPILFIDKTLDLTDEVIQRINR